MSQEASISQPFQLSGSRCPVCSILFKEDQPAASREIHTNKCLDKTLVDTTAELNDELIAQSLQESWQQESQSDISICTLCLKNLSKLNPMRKLIHISSCADQNDKIKKKVKQMKKENTEPLKNKQCPLCSKTLKETNFSSHVKQCSVKCKIPISQVLMILQKSNELLLTSESVINKCKSSEPVRNKGDSSEPVTNQKVFTKKKIKEGKRPQTMLVKSSAEIREAFMERALALAKNAEVCQKHDCLEESNKIAYRKTEKSNIAKKSLFLTADSKFMQNNKCKLWKLTSLKDKKNDESYFIPQLHPSILPSTELRTKPINNNLSREHCNEAFSATQTKKLNILMDLIDEPDIQSSGFIKESVKQEANSSHLEKLTCDMNLLLEESLFSDFVFHCDSDIKIPAHRCILAARSEEFKQITNQCHEVYISEFSPSAVGFMLKFMYTGSIDVPYKDAHQVLQLAYRYKLNSLRDACTAVLAENGESDVVDNIVSSFWEDQDKCCGKKFFINKSIDRDEDEMTEDSCFSANELELVQEVFRTQAINNSISLAENEEVKNFPNRIKSKLDVTQCSAKAALNSLDLHELDKSQSQSLKDTTCKVQNCVLSLSVSDLRTQHIDYDIGSKQTQTLTISDDDVLPSDLTLCTPKIPLCETPLLFGSRSNVGEVLIRSKLNNLYNSSLDFRNCYTVKNDSNQTFLSSPRYPLRNPYNPVNMKINVNKQGSPGVVTPGTYANFCSFNEVKKLETNEVEKDCSILIVNNPNHNKAKCSSPLPNNQLIESPKRGSDRASSPQECFSVDSHFDINNLTKDSLTTPSILTKSSLIHNSKLLNESFSDTESVLKYSKVSSKQHDALSETSPSVVKSVSSPVRKRRKLIADPNFGEPFSTHVDCIPNKIKTAQCKLAIEGIEQKGNSCVETMESQRLATSENLQNISMGSEKILSNSFNCTNDFSSKLADNHPFNLETELSPAVSTYYDGDDGGYNSIVFEEKYSCGENVDKKYDSKLQNLFPDSPLFNDKSNTFLNSPVTLMARELVAPTNALGFPSTSEFKKRSHAESPSQKIASSSQRVKLTDKGYSVSTNTPSSVKSIKSNFLKSTPPKESSDLYFNDSTIKTPIAESYDKFGPGCCIHPETKAVITPMPDYSSLPTPELAARTSSYALRELPKKKMVAKLKEIYKYQHKFKKWEEEPQKTISKRVSKKKKVQSEALKKSPVKTKTAKKRNLEKGCSETKEKLMLFIRENNALHQKILKYEPLEITELSMLLKKDSVDINKKDLLSFLDEQCICYYSKDEENKWNRRRKKNSNKS